jgi:hypothetical protein
MTSWTLFRYLTSFWRLIDNPIFMRETERAPLWHTIYARLSKATGVSLMFGGLFCYLSTLLVFYVNNLLILLLPVLLLWTFLIGLTLAPVIVGERERQTWDILRTAPLPNEMMVLGKASGALWWMSDLIHVMMGLLVLIAIGIGLISLILTPTTPAGYPTGVPSGLLCGATLIVPPLMALLFILDRGQQFVLIVVSSLTASATARSVRTALASALGAVLVVWLIDFGVALVVVAVLPDRVSATGLSDLLALLTLGPLVGYLAAFSLGKAVVLLLLTLVGREFMVRRLWRWTMHAACEA